MKKSKTITDSSSNLTNIDSIFFQETPKVLAGIVERIAEINEVQQQHVGYAGSESSNYKNYHELRKIASTRELLVLTDHKNPVVACYAGWALADESYPDLAVIFTKYLKHDRQVETFSGCIRSNSILSNELYHRYWNRVRHNDKILCELDSIILYNDNSYWLLTLRALENRIYDDTYKQRIENLAFKQGNKDAIKYLSNWYKAEYKDKIKTALVRYLNATNFRNTGVTDYYETLEELFKFKDNNIRIIIIAKLKKDRHWEAEKERFKYLFEDNSIYDVDSE